VSSSVSHRRVLALLGMPLMARCRNDFGNYYTITVRLSDERRAGCGALIKITAFHGFNYLHDDVKDLLYVGTLNKGVFYIVLLR